MIPLRKPRSGENSGLIALKTVSGAVLNNGVVPYAPSYWPTSNGRLVVRMLVVNAIPLAAVSIKSPVDGVTQFTCAIYNSEAQTWTQLALVATANTEAKNAGDVQTVFNAPFAGLTLQPGAYLLTWRPGPSNAPVTNVGSFAYSRADDFSTNTTLSANVTLRGSAHENGFFNARTDSNPAVSVTLAGGTTKAVTGPLDPIDMPVVAAVADLPAGAVALLDPGNTAPRLIRKRADGTVWYGALFTSVP